MKRVILLLINFLFALLSACKLPATGVPPATLLPEAAYTEAVMTIVAGYTQTVQSPGNIPEQTATLPPGEVASPTFTQMPEMTETPVPMVSPTETFSPVTQAVPMATPSLSASDPRAGLGEPVFRDGFDNAQNWLIYSDEHVKILIEDGKMVMTAKKPDFYNAWVLTWLKTDDFYLEATATSRACGGRDRFGLIFRVPDVSVRKGYLFAFSCSGMYSIWYWNGEKETDLIDWKVSDLIVAGDQKTNRIGIRAVDDQLALFANGNLITTLTDDRLDSGYFGVFVGSAQTQDYTAEFDEIACWEIK